MADLERTSAESPPSSVGEKTSALLSPNGDLAGATDQFSSSNLASDQTAQFSTAGSMDRTPPVDTQGATLDGPDSPRERTIDLPPQGDTFGDYELVREIARGGMGVVFQARQRSLDRTVALKMILDGQLANDTAVQRFYKEAQAAAGLDHPNIVPIYEIGQQGNRHYFTMAFIEGASLKGLVHKHRPNLSQALEYIVAIAEAVAHAHAKNIIHRDLKPDNVLIDTQNRPRVTDFGLAKRIQGDVNLTGAGQILGTPSYMAPEQALGGDRKIGPEADVYALGGIFYFLLTGRPPIQGDSLGEVLCRVISEPPVKPQEFNPDVPDEVQELILKCLEKDPAKRFSTAGELTVALKDLSRRYGQFTSDSTQPISQVRPAHLPAKNRWPLVAGLAAVFLIGVGLSLLADPFGWFGDQSKPDGGLPRTGVNSPNPNNPNLALVPIAFEADPVNDFQDDKPVHLQIPEANRKDFGLKVTFLGGTLENEVVQLKEKQNLAIQVETEKDAYVAVWSFESDGSINQLFPNATQKDPKFKAGKPRIIPDPGDEITASKSKGIEYLRVIASERPWNMLPTGVVRDGFQVCEDASQKKAFIGQLRGLVGKCASSRDTPLSEQIVKYLVKAAP